MVFSQTVGTDWQIPHENVSRARNNLTTSHRNISKKMFEDMINECPDWVKLQNDPNENVSGLYNLCDRIYIYIYIGTRRTQGS